MSHPQIDSCQISYQQNPESGQDNILTSAVLRTGLALRLLGEVIRFYETSKTYHNLLNKLQQRKLFDSLVKDGRDKLIAHLKRLDGKSHPTESRNQVNLIFDKTTDGM